MMLGCKGLSVIFLMTCTFSYGRLILVSFTSCYPQSPWITDKCGQRSLWWSDGFFLHP